MAGKYKEMSKIKQVILVAAVPTGWLAGKGKRTAVL